MKIYKSAGIFLALMSTGVYLSAQDAAAQAVTPPQSQNLLNITYSNILVVLAVLVLIGVILAALNLVYAMLELQKYKVAEKFGLDAIKDENFSTSKSLWQNISDSLWNLKPMEKEQDIDLGHDYDGIRELDNSLPPWWVWLFYGTIFWGVGYIAYYHITGKGPNQKQEYIAAMEAAEEQKALFLSTQANAIDETNVTLISDEASLAAGKEIYVANCAVCHGQSGEGLVGPNMTDKYWIHGGSINDIFKTIKYGVPEKGMISWKSQLNPKAMQNVASYLLTFQGTNPANQKAAEGELYEPIQTTPTGTDTTVVEKTVKDTTAVPQK
ncbi:MAG: cbb3-type cytochrome c oxidase N-terminal domain-containing protein [Saprospiraceae bacterium]